MCFASSPVRDLSRWNWEGDHIIHECIVPSSRPVVGYLKGHAYDIDVREFLITGRNEVVGRTLSRNVKAYVDKIPNGWELFQSRDKGSFDHRASVITAFVSKAIQYVYTSGRDPWQFPDETLHEKKGDCEDRALLIASLLIASGVSSYNVRVALGKMRLWTASGQAHDRDHVWVMYKTESGRWRVIEPLQTRNFDVRKRPSAKALHPVAAEYIPYFVFNDDHLWQIFHEENPKPSAKITLDRDWSQLHPSFAGVVHRNIIEDALAIPACPKQVREALLGYFSPAVFGLGPIVDKIDRELTTYDPADHFDNGLIDEGWRAVNRRLSQFNRDSTNIDAFARAAHAIADFYSHSSYMHFANNAVPCDPDASDLGLSSPPAYGPGSTFDLTKPAFSMNSNLWKGSALEGATAWNGNIISGRYSQKRDSRTFFERVTRTVEGLSPKFGALPHHAEIAVDGDAKTNPLYQDPRRYAEQFQFRKAASILHIREAFVNNFNPDGHR